MDITIGVMLPPRGSNDFTKPGNNNYPMLSIIAVYPVMDVPAVVNLPITGYVHVTGVPDDKFDRIKEVLEQRYYDSTDPLDVKGSPKRKWAGVASLLSNSIKNQLVNNRQITVTWTQFRNFLQNIKEQRSLTDADIA